MTMLADIDLYDEVAFEDVPPTRAQILPTTYGAFITANKVEGTFASVHRIYPQATFPPFGNKKSIWRSSEI